MRQLLILSVLFIVVSLPALVQAEEQPAAQDPVAAAPNAGGLGLADVSGHFSKVAKATTTAQVFAFQKKAMGQVKGASIEATFVVTDVKAVVLNKVDKYSIEGRHAEPAFDIKFYSTDEDAALAINVGDTVTVRGTGHGVFFGKKPSLAVDDATVVAVQAGAASAAE